MTADAEFAAAVERLSVLMRDKQAELAETVRLAEAGDPPGALALVRTDRGKVLMDEARTVIEDLTRTADQIVADRLDGMRFSARALTWVSSTASVLILLLAAGAVWSVTRYTRELLRARREVEAANAGLEERVARAYGGAEPRQRGDPALRLHRQPRSAAPLVNILGFTSELETGMQTFQRYLESGRQPTADLADAGARSPQTRTCPRRSASSAPRPTRWIG